MKGKNKNITGLMKILAGISIILLCGCIQPGEEGYKPLIEEQGENQTKTGDVNDSKIENASDISPQDTAAANLTEQPAGEDLNISENLAAERQESKHDYLFGWDDIPGEDNYLLLKFLEEELDIYWANNSKISKSDDNKVITAKYGRNQVNLNINEAAGKITVEIVKITRGEDYDFIFREENGDIKVYMYAPEEDAKIKKIKFDVPYGLVQSDDATQITSKLQTDVRGIIYAQVDFTGKNGEVLFDESRITTGEVLKEAGYIKTPGGLIIKDFTIELTEEDKCTVEGSYYCCGSEDCKQYKIHILENQTKQESLQLKYLFIWNYIPGNDNMRLLNSLKEGLGMQWADKARIKKSDDGKKITASYEGNSVNLELKESENKIAVEIIEVTGKKDYDFIFKTENNKLNVYLPEAGKLPQIKRIKFNIPHGLATSNDAGQVNSKLLDLYGVIYANIDFTEKNGLVLFNTPEITAGEILKEASYIKTPGGLIVLDLTVELTEDVNCTKNYEFYCCGKEDCRVYA